MNKEKALTSFLAKYNNAEVATKECVKRESEMRGRLEACIKEMEDIFKSPYFTPIIHMMKWNMEITITAGTEKQTMFHEKMGRSENE